MYNECPVKDLIITAPPSQNPHTEVTMLKLFCFAFALILQSTQQFQSPPHLHIPVNSRPASPIRYKLSQLHSDTNNHHPPIRLNKAFKATHSRREADKLIASGRVLVNGSPPRGAGDRVTPFLDKVTLDGKEVPFEQLNVVEGGEGGDTEELGSNQFVYAKFYKPKGVVCTTDEGTKNNIITGEWRSIRFGAQQRCQGHH